MMVVLLVLLYHHNILRFFDFTIIIMVGFRVHGHIYNALSMIQNDATGSCAHAHMRARSSTYIWVGSDANSPLPSSDLLLCASGEADPPGIIRSRMPQT